MEEVRLGDLLPGSLAPASSDIESRAAPSKAAEEEERECEFWEGERKEATKKENGEHAYQVLKHLHRCPEETTKELKHTDQSPCIGCNVADH